ncbi:MAG: hypothetical protein JKY37_14075, partial [Nannocystaceae bacterium]|nr:hypothetical protein [Nannocystaceae bacterium]
MRISIPRLVIVLVLGWAPGCFVEATAPSEGARTVPIGEPDGSATVASSSPRVEFSGCLSSTRVPLVCSIRGGETRLGLWVGADRAPQIFVDGSLVDAKIHRASDGVGWTAGVQIPAGATRLRIVADTAVVDSGGWILTLEEADATPTLDAVMRDLSRGEPLDTFALSRAKEALQSAIPTLGGFARARTYHALVKLHLRMGNPVRAIETGHTGLTLALNDAEISTAIDIVHLLQHLHGTYAQEADAVFVGRIAELYMPRVSDALQTVRYDLFRARLALLRHDHRTALDALGLSQRRAARLGIVEDELGALTDRLPLLAALGRVEDSQAAVTRMLALLEHRPPARACEDSSYLSNAGWGLAVANLVTGSDLDAGRLLIRALDLVEPGHGCDVDSSAVLRVARQEARFNFAFEALVRKDYAALETRLAAIDDGDLSKEQTRYVAMAHAALALAHGDARAAQAIVDAMSAPPSDPILAWFFAVLRGEIAEARNQPERALHAYLEAERGVDAAVAAAGFDHGREGLVAGLRLSAMRAIALQLAQGRSAEAAQTARRSRARALRELRGAAIVPGLSSQARAQRAASMRQYREASQQLHRELEQIWTLSGSERRLRLQRLGPTRAEMRAHLRDAYASVGTN